MAGQFGIDEAYATNYIADSRGTEHKDQAVSEAISFCRLEGKISKHWRDRVERDDKTRS